MAVFRRRLILFAVCLIIGCSGGEPGTETDHSDRSLELLTNSLDSWKDGSAGSLAGRDPPIRFVDDDWAAGRQLVAYQLEDPDTLVSPFETVFVNLTLQSGGGKTIERKVGYQVSLTPGFAVLRSEP
jgi:hypothetical protein